MSALVSAHSASREGYFNLTLENLNQAKKLASWEKVIQIVNNNAFICGEFRDAIYGSFANSREYCLRTTTLDKDFLKLQAEIHFVFAKAMLELFKFNSLISYVQQSYDFLHTSLGYQLYSIEALDESFCFQIYQPSTPFQFFSFGYTRLQENIDITQKFVEKNNGNFKVVPTLIVDKIIKKFNDGDLSPENLEFLVETLMKLDESFLQLEKKNLQVSYNYPFPIKKIIFELQTCQGLPSHLQETLNNWVKEKRIWNSKLSREAQSMLKKLDC